MSGGRLTGRRIVVLGGTSGIGEAVARSVVAAGATAVIASRTEGRAAGLAQTLESAEGHALDVSDEAAVGAFFATVGAFDHLLVTANVPVGGPIQELEPETALRGFATKFWGQFWAARHGARQIAPDGSITLISGIVAWRPSPGSAVGSSINAAVVGLGRALAVELAPVRVNVVSPGIVDSPAWATMGAERQAAFLAAKAAGLPVGRVGTPQDIADAILGLMTNGFVTGTVAHADGGAQLA